MDVDVGVRPGLFDCEALRPALVAQPVNTISSLAFVVVGIAVAVVATRRRSLDSITAIFVACLVATGVGSVLYHGPQPPSAVFVHDASIALLVALVVVTDAHGRCPRLAVVPMFAAAATAIIVGTLVVPMSAEASTGVLVVVAAVLEWRRFRGALSARRRGLAVLSVAVLAVVAALLGRSASPLCDPTGVLQLHAAWHVLAASTCAMWWITVMPGRGVAVTEPVSESGRI